MLVQRVHVQYPVMTEMIDHMEQSGVMPPLHDASFNGYADTPDELRERFSPRTSRWSRSSVSNASRSRCSYVDERMNDPQERALLLDVLRAVESVPELLGAGPHLLATARKR